MGMGKTVYGASPHSVYSPPTLDCHHSSAGISLRSNCIRRCSAIVSEQNSGVDCNWTASMRSVRMRKLLMVRHLL